MVAEKIGNNSTTLLLRLKDDPEDMEQASMRTIEIVGLGGTVLYRDLLPLPTNGDDEPPGAGEELASLLKVASDCDVVEAMKHALEQRGSRIKTIAAGAKSSPYFERSSL